MSASSPVAQRTMTPKSSPSNAASAALRRGQRAIFKVDQEHVRAAAPHHRQERIPVFGKLVKPFVAVHELDTLTQVLIVIDDQHHVFRLGHSAGGACR
jgi:hypothetical protein